MMYLEPQGQPFINGWMFGETTIFYIKIWNHPIETSVYKWLALGFQVGKFTNFVLWNPGSFLVRKDPLTRKDPLFCWDQGNLDCWIIQKKIKVTKSSRNWLPHPQNFLRYMIYAKKMVWKIYFISDLTILGIYVKWLLNVRRGDNFVLRGSLDFSFLFQVSRVTPLKTNMTMENHKI